MGLEGERVAGASKGSSSWEERGLGVDASQVLDRCIPEHIHNLQIETPGLGWCWG